MTAYLFNVQEPVRKHRDIFWRREDKPLEAFFDLELSGPQAEMVPEIEAGTECIVASYARDRVGAVDRSKVVFTPYTFAKFDTRPTNDEPEGKRYRVFLGTRRSKPTDPMPKGDAAKLERYAQFFNELENFKGISAFQR